VYKKIVTSLMTVAASTMLLVGCGGGGSQTTSGNASTGTSSKEFAGRTLTIASYGGALDDAIKKYVATEFEQETGAKVVMDPSYKLANLIADKGHPSVDLMYLDDGQVIQGGQLGLLQKLDSSKISNWADLYPSAIDKKGYGVAWVFGSYGIAYNTDKIKTPPTSWNDLWNPAYKGHVAVNNLTSNGGIQAFVAAASLGGGNVHNMDPAFQRFEKLAPNLLTVSPSTAEMTQLLSNGDVWIAPWWDGRALNLQAQGAHVGFVRPKEGSYATIVEYAIPKGSKNADMAYKFMDMTLQSKAQIGLAKDMYYGPTLKTTKLPSDLASKVVYGEAAVKSLQIVDWPYIATVRAQWIDKWNKDIVPLIGK